MTAVLTSMIIFLLASVSSVHFGAVFANVQACYCKFASSELRKVSVDTATDVYGNGAHGMKGVNQTFDLPSAKCRAAPQTVSNVAISEGNGGESRKSFHGYPKGYAQLIHSPESFHITSMQIDTRNRACGTTPADADKCVHTGPGNGMELGLNRSKPGVPSAGTNYSGLLECPCNSNYDPQYYSNTSKAKRVNGTTFVRYHLGFSHSNKHLTIGLYTDGTFRTCKKATITTSQTTMQTTTTTPTTTTTATTTPPTSSFDSTFTCTDASVILLAIERSAAAKAGSLQNIMEECAGDDAGSDDPPPFEHGLLGCDFDQGGEAWALIVSTASAKCAATAASLQAAGCSTSLPWARLRPPSPARLQAWQAVPHPSSKQVRHCACGLLPRSMQRPKRLRRAGSEAAPTTATDPTSATTTATSTPTTTAH
eukprot:gene14206-28048_t